MIKKHDDFLAKEAEAPRLLAKMHQHAVNVVDNTSLRIIAGLEVGRVTLMLTWIGGIPGVVLTYFGLFVGVPAKWLHQRHTRKTLKHSRIKQGALDNHASIHKQV